MGEEQVLEGLAAKTAEQDKLESAGPERKVVTIIFADMVGSTMLAARLDPERFREVMAAYYEAASEELTSLRGRVEKFIGDAVMAVFGVPHSHEDDALRAVRAGLSIRDRMVRLGEDLRLDTPLSIRVGVVSGPVATGMPSGPTGIDVADQFLVSGPSVNLAVRLQQAAKQGEVLVGETTWQLTRHAVEFGSPRTVDAPGFDHKITAWPALRLSARSTRRTIPLVDRRSELSLLRDAFERARSSSRPHMVTMLGEAGIGKTRLADELIAGLPDETVVLTGRANEFEEDPTFSALAEMVRRELGVDQDVDREKLRKRLDEVVEGCCEPTDRQEVVARLGLLLGLGEETGDGHRYRAAEIRAGFQTFVEGLARSGPVVLVFDDLQLARGALLDVIEKVVRKAQRVPLLVVGLAREELLERRPEWGGGLADAFTIRLDPLSLKEGTALAESAGENLDEATAERIAIHAGGNPFFIVETTGMMLNEHVDDVDTALHSHLLPPTVQAVVASRIDHLPEDARSLVRRASVFARGRFHVSELELIASPSSEILRALEEAEIFVPDGDEPGAYRFRHDLLRDVAYETLAKRQRLRLHAVVARGLTREGPDRHPQAVAYHLEQAARASLDLDPNDRSMAERAIPALERAGDLARWNMDSRGAIDLYERAIALTGPDDTWGPGEARLLSSIGECRYWLGEYDEAVAFLERALQVAPDDTWTRTHAQRFLADITLNVYSDPDRATELFDRALAAAKELDEPFAVARTLLMAGWAPFWRNDLAAARSMFEEALEIARSNQDAQAESRALTSLISVISPVGDEMECLELGRQALAVSREAGEPFAEAVSRTYLGNSLRRMFQLDEALSCLDGALQTFRDLEARWEMASTLNDRADVLRLMGRFDEAETDLREGLRICKGLGERNLIAWIVGDLVQILVDKGDLEAARHTFRKFRGELEREPSPQTTLAATEVVLALAEGNRERALERSLWLLETRRTEGQRNSIAAQVWWTGTIFGPETVGGDAALAEARARLEAAHWLHAIREPELVKG